MENTNIIELNTLTQEQKEELYQTLANEKSEERKEAIIASLKKAGETTGNIAVEVARYTTKVVAAIGNTGVGGIYGGLKGIILGAKNGAVAGWKVWQKTKQE